MLMTGELRTLVPRCWIRLGPDLEPIVTFGPGQSLLERTRVFESDPAVCFFPSVRTMSSTTSVEGPARNSYCRLCGASSYRIAVQ